VHVRKLKHCPRCAGDVFTSYDSDNGYEQCLQCGWERELTVSRARGAKWVVREISTHSKGPYRRKRATEEAGSA